MKKQILQVTVIVFGIVFSVMLAARFLRRDEGFVKNHDFYETNETYDVLYLGSSHAVMGILPMEIWNEYGITSFNLANGGQKLNGDYWILKNALEQKRPELVVLDVYTVTIDQKWDETTINFLHESLDPIPMSKTKIDAIYDLVPEEKRLAFLWPFSTYHNRWESVNRDFFISNTSCQKGAYENTDHVDPRVTSMEALPVLERTDADMRETVGKEYLRKSIELCQEQGVPILLTAIPFKGNEEELRFMNSVYKIAEEYGVPFINGAEEAVVNPECDFLDATHLNSSGARKWSSFLGKYLQEQYGLLDRRSDAAYAGWHDAYATYRVFEKNQLNGTTDLYGYLMLLADSGFSSYIRISEGAGIYGDDLFWALLKNAGAAERTKEDSSERIFLLDHSRNGTSFSFEESLGFPDDVNADLEVVVVDSRTGELVSHAGFLKGEENVMVYPVKE